MDSGIGISGSTTATDLAGSGSAADLAGPSSAMSIAGSAKDGADERLTFEVDSANHSEVTSEAELN